MWIVEVNVIYDAIAISIESLEDIVKVIVISVHLLAIQFTVDLVSVHLVCVGFSVDVSTLTTFLDCSIKVKVIIHFGGTSGISTLS
jgi:hypothetical protein